MTKATITEREKYLRTWSSKYVLQFQKTGVFKIDGRCGSSYIGQIKRSIYQRVKEHIAAVKNWDINESTIAEHLLQTDTNHWIELLDPKRLTTERHFIPRLVRRRLRSRSIPNSIGKMASSYRDRGIQ